MKQYLKTLALAITLCLFTLSAKAQLEGYSLSPEAKISLITCSTGEDLYTIFGHSAVRVYDPSNGLDLVFNYGTFDFNEPNFYLKFIQGKLRYKLSVAYFQDFVYSYAMDNRSVYEQNLNLTEQQKTQYWTFLANNYLPENRFYLYDFFFDNCATRIRDGVEATFPDSVQFRIDHLDENMTFRNLIDLYLPPQPWSDFGIDLGLGALIDRRATPYEYMFLPDYLAKGFANATIQQDGQAVPLAGEMQVVYQQQQPTDMQAPFFTPLLAWWALFIITLAITIFDYIKRKRSRTFDVFLFLVTGLLGVVLFLLWFATDHQATALNYNLLWALPTHALVAAWLGRRRLPSLLIMYMFLTVIATGLLLVAWAWWPQQLHVSVFPLALALVLRAAYTVWFSNRQRNKQNNAVLSHA